MAGNQNSGRRPNFQELDIRKLLERSYQIQMEFLDDENVPLEKKVEYASRYLAKRVGEKIDVEVRHMLDENQMARLTGRLAELKLLESNSPTI